MAKKATIFGLKTAQKLYALLGAGPGYSQPPLGSSRNEGMEFPMVFRNDSGETVPPYACMKVTDVVLSDSRYIVVIDKPDDSGGPFVFNGSFEVEAGKRGTFQRSGVVRAKTSGSVTCGECWGPISDWVIVQDGNTCITVFGSPESGIAIGQTLPDSDCVESASDSDSSFLCTQIPGVDLDSIEAVAAETVDYVLAIRSGCLVKVAVSDCAGSGSV